MFSWRAELQPGGPGSPGRLCFSTQMVQKEAGLAEHGTAQPGVAAVAEALKRL